MTIGIACYTLSASWLNGAAMNPTIPLAKPEREIELQEAFNEARDAVREASRIRRLAEEKVARLRQLQLESAEHEQAAA